MKLNKEIDVLIQMKEEIVADMKACITYEPHRENDLLCLMERYIKSAISERPRLLDQIKKCMTGTDYENPFEAYYCYSVDDIERFEQLLTGFIEQSKRQNYKAWERELEIKNLIQQLNNLNVSCQGELIDTYRREKLLRFFEDAEGFLKIDGIKGIVNELRSW
ncbi:MAG: hypothetical protein CVU95_01325 [Firmicutes bacterium HGW-Firmicutes-2]|jgi:hypothetical protein|nr:MAG: hypothetical protein CVU95_01325 [Firmicutes bacterium HGW-Firmicutes-2]